MNKETYHYAHMKPELLDKLQQAERELGRLSDHPIVLVAYEKDKAEHGGEIAPLL